VGSEASVPPHLKMRSRITVVDRSTITISALLYQVATATLAPGDLAAPIHRFIASAT
jgi:NADH dehydrogenase FAD-containing subunit